MLVAMSPLQRVIGYLSISYIWEAGGTGAEESYTRRNVGLHFQRETDLHSSWL